MPDLPPLNLQHSRLDPRPAYILIATASLLMGVLVAMLAVSYTRECPRLPAKTAVFVDAWPGV